MNQPHSFDITFDAQTNAERCLEVTSAYDIVDRVTLSESEREDEERRLPDNLPDDLPLEVRSASTAGGTQSPGRSFMVTTPPRQIGREQWDAYNNPTDHARGPIDRSGFFAQDFSDLSVIEEEDRPIYRRPYDGTAPRHGAPGRISVLKSDGTFIPLLKAPRGTTKYYTDFTLAGWQHAPAERHQITASFGADFLKVFGRNPHFISMSGVLVDTPLYNWKSVFMKNWDTVLRATRLVELDARAIITVDELVLEGYFLKGQFSKRTSNHKIVGFQVIFYAKDIRYLDPNIVAYEIGTSVSQMIPTASEERIDRLSRARQAGAEAVANFETANQNLGEERLDTVRRRREDQRPTRASGYGPDEDEYGAVEREYPFVGVDEEEYGAVERQYSFEGVDEEEYGAVEREYRFAGSGEAEEDCISGYLPPQPVVPEEHFACETQSAYSEAGDYGSCSEEPYRGDEEGSELVIPNPDKPYSEVESISPAY